MTYYPSDPSAPCSGGETIVPGSLRGYREWRVALSSPLGIGALNELYGDWAEPAITADCHAVPTTSSASRMMLQFANGVNSLPPLTPGRSAHPATPAPQSSCRCGIYAWYRHDLIDGSAFLGYGGGRHDPLAIGRVVGAVAASGRILLGTRGFRAERAQVLAVVTRHAALQQLLRLAGVDVCATIDELTDRYPPDDVAELGIDVDQISPEMRSVEDTIYLAFHVSSLSYADALRMARQSNPGIARYLATPPPPTTRRRRPAPADRLTAEQQRVLSNVRRSRGTGPAARERAPRALDPKGRTR